MHVIQRGNNRAACFAAEDDYSFYLHQLGEMSTRFECRVHAYVLMTNHVHLLLTPMSHTSVSLMMKHLGQRYVQHFNRCWRRTGTLWEGRFKSCLTQTESYVLRCYRYIELNPVRAGMVAHPRAYRWSSYRVNAEGLPSILVDPHEEFQRLGRTSDERRTAYRTLFDSRLDEAEVAAIRAATNGNFALGGERFTSAIEAALGRRARRGVSGRPWPKTSVG